LRFSLRAGSFATVVLRELVTLVGGATEDEHA
jgi:tRNA(Glu) U13 pseudouridine synthase TruD